jgi:hydroxycarboxylate dehydrogenase B
MPVFSERELYEFCYNILVRRGASTEEAERVATHLVTNNLVGHDSHGVIHLPGYVGQVQNGEIQLGTKPEILRETPTIAVLDGHWGFGQLIAKQAMDLAISKAAQNSISCVGVRHCNHIGRLGEYTVMAAKQDMIGILSANDAGGGLAMAPFGGIERRLSPNPISIAFPSGVADRPILLDMSSTTVAQGKLAIRRNRGETLPEGWAIDAKGRPVVDPKDYWGPPEGALLPLGGMTAGHKGFGLGFVLDILDGVLGGAGVSRAGVTRLANGLFISVIKIEDFVPLEEFQTEVQNLTRYVKSSAHAPGFSEILVPGEFEFRGMTKRRESGIQIEDETWKRLRETALAAGLEIKP